MTPSRYPSLFSLCAIVGLGAAVDLSQAATKYYVGQSTGNSRWHQTANWHDGSPPAPGDDVVIGTGLYTTLAYNMVSRTQLLYSNFNSITFTNGGFTVTAVAEVDTLLLSAGITNEAGVISNNTVRVSIYQAAPLTFLNASTNSTLIFNPDLSYVSAAATLLAIDNKGFDVTFDGDGSFTFGANPTFPGYIRGAGGLVKRGAGTLTFINSSNTFTGPVSLHAGRLVLATVQTGTSALTVQDQATLGATVSRAGTTLRVPTLVLGSAAGPTTNELNLGIFGNPTEPVIRATNLWTTGTVYLSVSGVGLAVGQFPLIQYETLGGHGYTFVSNGLPPGVSGYFSNNLARRSIDLVLTQVPELRWTGRTNSGTGDVAVGLWDVGITTNWVDMQSGTPSFFVNGMSVNFDDTAATNVVALATNVAPFNVRVNTAATYTLTNTVSTNRIEGTARLIKEGPGTLILGVATNTYSGPTTLQAGTLRLAAHEAIGNPSSVTNQGVLDLNGFTETIGGLSGPGLVTNSAATGGPTNTLTVGNNDGSGAFSGRIVEGPVPLALTKVGLGAQQLSGPNQYSGGTTVSAAGSLLLGADNVLGSGPLLIANANAILAPDSAAPRSLTNEVIIRNAMTFGAPGAGLLTLSGRIGISHPTPPGDRNLTFLSDAVFSGPSLESLYPGVGLGDKLGPGTLTLRNLSGMLSNNNALLLREGALVLDGASVTLASGLRLRCDIPDRPALLRVTNGGVLSIPYAGSNLRLGDAGLGSPLATNRAEIHGTLRIPNGSINMGYDCQRALLQVGAGGLVEVISIAHVFGTNASVSEVRLDGGTLQPATSSVTFLQGLNEVYVDAGGVTVDTVTNAITIAQNLLAGTGAGGLTKKGAAALTLAGACTYAGNTLVQEGELVLTPAFAARGPVTVSDGTLLTADSSLGGSLNLAALALNGGGAAGTTLNLVIGLPDAAVAVIVATNFTAAGPGRNVINIAAGQPLENGKTYPLIASPGGVGSDSFGALKLGALPPGTTAILVNQGTSVGLQVGTSLPSNVGGIRAVGDGTFDLTIVGTPGQTVTLLATTNIALPLPSWAVLTNGPLPVSPFSYRDAQATNYPQRFYAVTNAP